MSNTSISDRGTTGTKNGEVNWRDYAGNLWLCESFIDDWGYSWSTDTLLEAADPENVPDAPVPFPPPVLDPEPPIPALPDDIGVKTLISDKGTTGIKNGHVYWRDAANNIWFAESYADSDGYSFGTQTLFWAADRANPPTEPVT